MFFEELANSLSKAVNKYDSLIVIGNFNIDLNKTDRIGLGKLEDFCDNFGLTNIVKRNTCFTKTNKFTIDLLLTNKPMSFQMTNTTETGLNDCHKLISSFNLYERRGVSIFFAFAILISNFNFMSNYL